MGIAISDVPFINQRIESTSVKIENSGLDHYGLKYYLWKKKPTFNIAAG